MKTYNDMSRKLALSIVGLLMIILGGYAESGKLTDTSEEIIEKKVKDLLELMTLEEKVGFFSGVDEWFLHDVKRVGIPSIKVTDGGHGVTVKDNGCSVCYPTAVGQAATWDRELIYELGAALGRDARKNKSNILLGPMVSIHRVPVGGRNYETYSEDPVLTGEMAAALIKGIQSENIGSVIKQFTANNQQAGQKGLIAEVSERALHEIYFPAFRIALEKSDPVGVMTAYNGVNGHPTSESKYLLTEILRKSWQYPGFIVSDWNAVVSSNSISAGVDIEMPGPGKFMDSHHMTQAVKDGLISKEEIDNRVGRYLRAIVRLKLLDTNRIHKQYSYEDNILIAQKVAEGSIVLLKNNQNLLPLDKRNIKKIAVLGPNALEARLGGGGSSSVTVCSSVSPMKGLEDYFKNDKVELAFLEGAGLKDNLPVIPKQYLLSEGYNGNVVNGLKGEYFTGLNMEGGVKNLRYDDKVDFSWGWAAPCDLVERKSYSVRWTGKLVIPATGNYKIGLSFSDSGVRLYIDGKLVVDEWGDPDNEIMEAKFLNKKKHAELFFEANREHDICLEFHRKERMNSIRLEWEIPNSIDPIEDAVSLAKKSDVAIIFAGLSNIFEGGMNDRKNLKLPGEQNRLISAVANANPNTIVVLINGTPLEMPWIQDVKSVIETFYPGQEGGHAIARILFGEVNPSGKLPDTFPEKMEDNRAMKNYPGKNNIVNYEEGIYIGYRQFEKDGVKPLFPFGHGLSYTSFKYKDIKVNATDHNAVIITFDITNSGKRKGSEVSQIYVRDMYSSEDRPVKELKGFEKTTLEPGETKTVKIVLDRYAFSFFSEKSKGWVLEPGEFEILVGSSSADIRLKKKILL